MIVRSIADYEQEIHEHRGQPIYGARHDKCAPFACNAPLLLNIEPSHRSKFESLIVERCQHCGRVAGVNGVLPEPVAVNNDDQDDGA